MTVSFIVSITPSSDSWVIARLAGVLLNASVEKSSIDLFSVWIFPH